MIIISISTKRRILSWSDPFFAEVYQMWMFGISCRVVTPRVACYFTLLQAEFVSFLFGIEYWGMGVYLFSRSYIRWSWLRLSLWRFCSGCLSKSVSVVLADWKGFSFVKQCWIIFSWSHIFACITIRSAHYFFVIFLMERSFFNLPRHFSAVEFQRMHFLFDFLPVVLSNTRGA